MTSATSDRSSSPLVSIVVPAFNGARFLRECVDSILAQRYRPIELIVLDDASTDETPSIMAEYGTRVRYVRQPTNRGQFDNVNDGIKLALGELICVYHADDVYLPTIVESEVAYMQAHPEVGAVFASDIFTDAQGREIGRLELPPETRGERPLSYATVLNALLTYKNRFLRTPTSMVRASVYREVGPYLPAKYRNTSDFEMWLRIAKRYPIAVLESHLLRYRRFHGSSSQNYHRLRTAPENFFIIVDEYLAAGDRALATPKALVSYEGHRSQDRLMAAIAHYVKDEMPAGRRALAEVRLPTIWRTPALQRTRLTIITLGLWLLLRLPRIEWIAQRMLKRWYMKQPPKPREQPVPVRA